MVTMKKATHRNPKKSRIKRHLNDTVFALDVLIWKIEKENGI